MTTPAGWYTDPDNPDQQRRWDGTSWTDERQPAPPTTPPEPRPRSKSGIISTSFIIFVGIILTVIPATLWLGPLVIVIGLLALNEVTIRKPALRVLAIVAAPLALVGGIIAGIAVSVAAFSNSPEQIAERLATSQRINWMTACEIAAENALQLHLDVDHGATTNSPTLDGATQGTIRLNAEDGSFTDALCAATGVETFETTTVTSLSINGTEVIR